MRLATWVESVRVQSCIVAVISLNAVILGLETDPAMMESWGFELKLADKICLVIFCIELGLKLACYRGMFWKSG